MIRAEADPRQIRIPPLRVHIPDTGSPQGGARGQTQMETNCASDGSASLLPPAAPSPTPPGAHRPHSVATVAERMPAASPRGIARNLRQFDVTAFRRVAVRPFAGEFCGSVFSRVQIGPAVDRDRGARPRTVAVCFSGRRRRKIRRREIMGGRRWSALRRASSPAFGCLSERTPLPGPTSVVPVPSSIGGVASRSFGCFPPRANDTTRFETTQSPPRPVPSDGPGPTLLRATCAPRPEPLPSGRAHGRPCRKHRLEKPRPQHSVAGLRRLKFDAADLAAAYRPNRRSAGDVEPILPLSWALCRPVPHAPRPGGALRPPTNEETTRQHPGRVRSLTPLATLSRACSSARGLAKPCCYRPRAPRLAETVEPHGGASRIATCVVRPVALVTARRFFFSSVAAQRTLHYSVGPPYSFAATRDLNTIDVPRLRGGIRGPNVNRPLQVAEVLQVHYPSSNS